MEPPVTRPINIISPDNWLDPLPIEDLFPSPAPLEVDVGCGKGRFLVARASKNPETNFLGIDRLLTRLRKVDKKIGRAGISNVRLLRLEADYSLNFLLPPESVSVFYVFFPDPWPKRRHHRRRLLQGAFLNSVVKTLVPSGIIHIATDHLNYYEEVHRLMTDSPAFAGIAPFEPTEDERTDFELIFLSKKAEIGRCSFQKVSDT